MQRTLVRLIPISLLVVVLAISGTAAFAATPDLDVFKHWSKTHAPYITNASGDPEAYVKMDLDQLFAVAPGNHWAYGGWYIDGNGMSSGVGNYGTGSQALGTVPKVAGIHVIPEPTSIALMGMGVFGLIGRAVCRRRSRVS